MASLSYPWFFKLTLKSHEIDEIEIINNNYLPIGDRLAVIDSKKDSQVWIQYLKCNEHCPNIKTYLILKYQVWYLKEGLGVDLPVFETKL